jgi:hypothetical protein
VSRIAPVGDVDGSESLRKLSLPYMEDIPAPALNGRVASATHAHPKEIAMSIRNPRSRLPATAWWLCGLALAAPPLAFAQSPWDGQDQTEMLRRLEAQGLVRAQPSMRAGDGRQPLARDPALESARAAAAARDTRQDTPRDTGGEGASRQAPPPNLLPP